MLHVSCEQLVECPSHVAGREDEGLGGVIEDASVRRQLTSPQDNAQRLLLAGQVEVVVVAHGQAGVVHEHGAGADQDGVASSAEPVGVSACGCGADPAGGAVGGRAATVEGGRELPGDERASLRVRERPGPVEGPGLVGHQSALDVDAALPQRLGAAARERVRVGLREDHPGHPGVREGLRARPGAAGVVAGLEGDDGGAAPGAVAGLGKGVDLGVRGAGSAVDAFGDRRTVRGQQDAADARVGPERHAGRLRQLEGARHGRALDVLAAHGALSSAHGLRGSR